MSRKIKINIKLFVNYPKILKNNDHVEQNVLLVTKECFVNIIAKRQ